MQRSTPLRNPHASTSDLLTWPELPPQDSAPAVSRSGHRSRQPSDKIGDVLRGGQLSEEEAQSLAKRKPCSRNQMKETTGSRIFSANAEDTASEASSANSKNRTGIRVYQQAVNGISQISFSTEESISLKKPASLPEAAKQRELSGTLQSEPDTNSKKQFSSAKTKELSGNDIFGPPQEIVPRSLAAPRTLESKESKDMGESDPRNVRRSVKTSKKTHDQKFAELTDNNIFKGTEKLRSMAKLREMAGSDIFADGKAENRDNILGSRRPPGGGSSISLV
ncbi:uncharacterized protein LOC133290638 isoform X2 [Gastrolobium bilobum]|uniref:uncharacterized protein LOC133290638 isoform X2 n=1 Tax=Gastrolobium bilobum TaxID=150636 RepID=UPI002AB2E8CA|nr:uncharacterized protein LOC133290638 isoform X2 [Gastrolobium bilobum]